MENEGNIEKLLDEIEDYTPYIPIKKRKFRKVNFVMV